MSASAPLIDRRGTIVCLVSSARAVRAMFEWSGGVPFPFSQPRPRRLFRRRRRRAGQRARLYLCRPRTCASLADCGSRPPSLCSSLFCPSLLSPPPPPSPFSILSRINFPLSPASTNHIAGPSRETRLFPATMRLWCMVRQRCRTGSPSTTRHSRCKVPRLRRTKAHLVSILLPRILLVMTRRRRLSIYV